MLWHMRVAEWMTNSSYENSLLNDGAPYEALGGGFESFLPERMTGKDVCGFELTPSSAGICGGGLTKVGNRVLEDP